MLSIRNLSKKYEGSERLVLNNIDLDVQPGEFVVILGLSGAGKSTLIRCINRLIEPTAGQIIWNGANVLTADSGQVRHYRQNIGMIFQSFNLIDQVTVLTNVLVGRFGEMNWLRALFGRFSQADIELAKQVLDRVNMAEYAGVKAKELSGGQRQRVAIARALAQNPKLILGDEPVSNLDPSTSESVMRLLQSICDEKGISMVINLHSVELAKKFAHRVIGIANGTIVFDNSPDKLTETVLNQIYKREQDMTYQLS